jgi:hypothetical protein
MTHAEILAVIQASKEGKPIQFRLRNVTGEWYDRTGSQTPDFNFCTYDYRMKPECRRPREWKIPSVILNSPDLLNWFRGCHSTGGDIHVREVLP